MVKRRWRTRTSGTPRQIGKKFVMDEESLQGKKARLPKLTGKITRAVRREPTGYTVNFKYSERKGDGETVVVIAKDYKSALAEAREERHDKREPIAVDIIDPDLGRVFKAIGEAAKTAGKFSAKAIVKGAKYSAKGLEIFGKAAGEEIAKKFDEYEERLAAKKMVRESYSSDRFKRLKARAALRKNFPEIYTVCDFSRPQETLYTVGREPAAPLKAEVKVSVDVPRTRLEARRRIKSAKTITELKEVIYDLRAKRRKKRRPLRMLMPIQKTTETDTAFKKRLRQKALQIELASSKP